MAARPPLVSEVDCIQSNSDFTVVSVPLSSFLGAPWKEIQYPQFLFQSVYRCSNPKLAENYGTVIEFASSTGEKDADTLNVQC